MSKDKSSSSSREPRLLETDFVRDALERLSAGLGAREPFLLVTGEAGTGKTVLVRAAIERWGDRATVAFVADPAMNRNELLEEIVRRFGAEVPAGATKPQLLARIEETIAAAAKKGRVPVVVIDDAHEASTELLGELRLLVNTSAQAGGPLEIVLAGLPALDTQLSEPAFAALRQRVAVHVVTQPFSASESRRFVHQVAGTGENAPARFPKQACREMHAHSGGVPRTLQTLARESERLAKAAGEAQVSVEHVTEAAAAMGLERASGRPAEAPDVPAVAAPVRPAHATEDDDHAPIPQAPHNPEVDGDLKPPVDVAKASDWIGKFISPDEPRFGDLIGTGQLAGFDEAGEGVDAESDPALDEVLKKLRRRRGRVLPRYRRGRRQAPEWLGTVALILVIIAALVTIAGPAKRMIVSGLNLMSASAERNENEQAARVASEGAAEPAGAAKDSEPAADVTPSKPEARSSSKPATPRTAAPEPYTPPAAPANRPAPPTQTSNPDQLWAVDVGTHPDAGTAGMDRDRLVEATGLRGWLVRSSSGYRVVLGIYSTRDRAESGSQLLREKGLVGEASVIPLPPRSERQ